MSEAFACDVLICGAGASGLTLALELARRGLSFRVIEKQPEPFRGSRGKGIQPRSQEVFADLGVLDRLVATGGLYPPQRTYRDDGSYQDSAIMEAAQGTYREPYTLPLMVPQFLTERVLRERLLELGQRVHFGCELVGVEQDAQGVRARVLGRDGEENIRARYLIGADGGRSFVRHALDIGFPGKTLALRAMVADVVLTGLSRDAWHRFGSDVAQQIMICPLAGTELFQLQGPVPLEGEVDLSREGVSRMVEERTGRTDIRIHSVSWASAFQMNARLADRYRVGRMFLVGDAAHVHPPTGGQGLNTSIQDAYNLGWKLAAVLGGAPAALLDSYEEERRPIAADMLGLSTKLLADLQGGELRRGREVHQLDLGYPRSSLVLADSTLAGPLRAGDRAPDAHVRGAAGQPTRLFELFKGTHWTLLGYEADRERVTPRAGVRVHIVAAHGDIVDSEGQVREAYGARPGDWVLVRPDGYIAALVAAGHVSALEGYFQTVGLLAEGEEHG
jgi:2-polyprenyl-6-methoxyphenol hydroxylase-like FAD-dependent oxidoreductase